MKIYLAGRGYLEDIIAGQKNMRVFLVDYCRFNWVAKNMNLYLVNNTAFRKYGESDKAYNPAELNKELFILQSFAYINEDKEIIPWIHKFKGFLLDSGAFTIFSQKSNKMNFEEYLNKYIKFINDYDVKQFFELDIDSVVGYEKVLEYRKKLEEGTGKKCIPVWHKSRGKEEFIKMCRDYPYVAIGGIVSKEITRDGYKYFPWFINQAHKYGAKIHGLGFTNLKGLQQYHFDSVDSSSWTTGNRFGFIYKFTGKTLIKIPRPEGHKVKAREVAINNFLEWIKFSKYAETHL